LLLCSTIWACERGQGKMFLRWGKVIVMQGKSNGLGEKDLFLFDLPNFTFVLCLQSSHFFFVL